MALHGDVYSACSEWQRNVYLTLNKHDMYAKMLTYRPQSQPPKYRLHDERIAANSCLGNDYEMSFLVIALTKLESFKLEGETWNQGDFEDLLGCPANWGRIL